jgi:hypothetical protein
VDTGDVVPVVIDAERLEYVRNLAKDAVGKR